jgi:hypothetical protein
MRMTLIRSGQSLGYKLRTRSVSTRGNDFIGSPELLATPPVVSRTQEQVEEPELLLHDVANNTVAVATLTYEWSPMNQLIGHRLMTMTVTQHYRNSNKCHPFHHCSPCIRHRRTLMLPPTLPSAIITRARPSGPRTRMRRHACTHQIALDESTIN